MNPAAVADARNCLERVNEALKILQARSPRVWADDLKACSNAWADVLIWGHRAISKLEQGAKHGSSSGWFGQITSQRRTDPLLSYMHHARNVDEHALVKVYETTKADIKLSIPQNKPAQFHTELTEDGHFLVRPLNSWTKVEGVERAGLLLKAAESRGRTYPVPDQHLGHAITESSARALSEIFSTYLTRVIDEAELRSKAMA